MFDHTDLPAPGDDPTTCPVCGWSPCTDECLFGLSQFELEILEGNFWGADPFDRQADSYPAGYFDPMWDSDA